MPVDKPYAHLVRLLRLAATESGASAFAVTSPSDEEWRMTYRLASKHAVVGVAWDGVERLQAEAPEVLRSMPADLMGKWFADVQTIEAANSRMAKQNEQVQALLKTGGFDSHILKGALLAAYYPQPVHRQAADIDLWVIPSQANHGLLKTCREKLLAYLKSRDIAVTAVVYHHIETMIDGADVELHVTPTWLCNPVHNRRLQRLFVQADEFTPELQEAYALLHAFRHIYHDGLALRHVLDYYLVCRHNRKMSITSPQALYGQLGLTRFARTMDELSAYLFDNPDAEPISSPAQHLLAAVPQRKVSRRAKWDYPSETLCVLPWRTIHYLWRKAHHYL